MSNMMDLMNKVNRMTCDDGAFDDVKFWIQSPFYQDMVVDVKEDMITNEDGLLVKHIIFLYEGDEFKERGDIGSLKDYFDFQKDIRNREEKFKRMINYILFDDDIDYMDSFGYSYTDDEFKIFIYESDGLSLSKIDELSSFFKVPCIIKSHNDGLVLIFRE